jgi:TRAP-type C4-dicarboxylate transport system permease small subunit
MGAEPNPLEGGEKPRTRIPLGLEEVTLAAAMAAIALITIANVATRYLSNVSLAFTEEFSVVLMLLVAVFGSSLAMATGRHVRIGFFVDLLGPRRGRIVEVLGMVLSMGCFLLIAWYGGRAAYDDYRFEVTSPGLGYPQWIYTATLPIVSLLVAGRAAGRAARIWRGEGR